MAKAKFSENTYYKVQRNCQDNISTKRNKKSCQKTGNTSCTAQSLHHYESYDYNCVSDEITSLCFIHILQHNSIHLHFLLNLLAQKSCRLHKQHNNQNCEHDCICKLGRNVCLTEYLDDSQKNSSDKCTRNRTDSSKYCCNERFDTRHRTGIWCQARVSRTQKHTGYCCQSGTNCKCKSNCCSPSPLKSEVSFMVRL